MGSPRVVSIPAPPPARGFLGFLGFLGFPGFPGFLGFRGGGEQPEATALTARLSDGECENVASEDRSHVLRIMGPTHYQLRYRRHDI